MSRLPRPAGAQRGMALLVVLVLLLLVTLLGLASLRGALMEERMTASLYDRSLSFQSAEAALREGEALALTRPTAPPSGCNAGVCSTPATAAEMDRWLNPAFAGWRNAAVDLAATPSAGAPQFIVEPMGVAPNWVFCEREIPMNPNCMSPRYRITARSAAVADRSQVLLQSNFSTP